MHFVFTHFQPITQHYKQRAAWKAYIYITCQSNCNQKYGRYAHQSNYQSVKSGCVTDWVTVCHSILLTARVKFQAKNSIRSSSASNALTTKTIMLVLLIVTFEIMEKWMGTKKCKCKPTSQPASQLVGRSVGRSVGRQLVSKKLEPVIVWLAISDW